MLERNSESDRHYVHRWCSLLAVEAIILLAIVIALLANVGWILDNNLG